MKRREPNEVVYDIKKEIPNFDKEELLEYTKWAIQVLHHAMRNENRPEVKCKDDLLNKMINEKLKYRITREMDHLSIQFIELANCEKKNNEFLIKVYVSIYFYDDVDNNINVSNTGDKYWNDIWYITYRQDAESADGNNSNCSNCGAIMEYNHLSKLFKCNYCGKTDTNILKVQWEIVDIEVEH